MNWPINNKVVMLKQLPASVKLYAIQHNKETSFLDQIRKDMAKTVGEHILAKCSISEFQAGEQLFFQSSVYVFTEEELFKLLSNLEERKPNRRNLDQ